MSQAACEFCCDAGADFDWCRVCGRGAMQHLESRPVVDEAALLQSLNAAQVAQRLIREATPDARFDPVYLKPRGDSADTVILAELMDELREATDREQRSALKSLARKYLDSKT
jgi:hypothetical protein